MAAKASILIVFLFLLAGIPVIAAADTGTSCGGVRVVGYLPATAAMGEKVTIRFAITNNGQDAKSVTVTQVIPGDADFDTALAVKREVVNKGTGYICFGANCSTPPPGTGLSSVQITTNSYAWTVMANPGETQEVSSWIVPKAGGDLLLHPASVTVGSETCLLPARGLTVGCTAGHACDPSKGENSLTCPQNCANWSADTVCNPERDGQCDPDCRPGADPDCGGATTKPTPAPLLPATAAAAALAAVVLGRKFRKE